MCNVIKYKDECGKRIIISFLVFILDFIILVRGKRKGEIVGEYVNKYIVGFGLIILCVFYIFF